MSKEISLQLVKELRDRTQLGLNACREALIKCDGDIEAAIDFLKKAGEIKAADKAGRIATEGKIVTFIKDNRAVIAEVNCQTDFVSKGNDFDQFSKAVVFYLVEPYSTPENLESTRKELVAKTGENIVIRRFSVLEAINERSLLVSYNHPGDRIAVLIEAEAPTLESYNSQEFANFVIDCAMQVAAMNPLSVDKVSIPIETLNKQKELFMQQMMEDEKLKNKPTDVLNKICEGKLAKWCKEVTLLEQESVISADKQSVDSLRITLGNKLGGTVLIHRFIRFELGEGLEKKNENLAEEVAKLLNS